MQPKTSQGRRSRGSCNSGRQRLDDLAVDDPMTLQVTGELASLFVSPAHENQGIGRKLAQFVEDRARAMGVTLSRNPVP